jgi:hypothetical protein
MGVVMGTRPYRFVVFQCEHVLVHTLAVVDSGRIRSGLRLRAQVHGVVVAGSAMHFCRHDQSIIDSMVRRTEGVYGFI